MTPLFSSRLTIFSNSDNSLFATATYPQFCNEVAIIPMSIVFDKINNFVIVTIMKKKLQSLGISNKAVDIYLELLQRGPSSVDSLSTATGIKRTNIYPYINELKSSKLISWKERQVNKAISITDPKKIIDLAKRKKAEAENNLDSISSLLPKIEAMHQVNNSDYYVMKYIGEDECRQVLEGVYECETLCGYCDQFIYPDLESDWYVDHLKKLYIEHQVSDRVIFPKDIIRPNLYKDLKQTEWYNEKTADYRFNETIKLPEGMDVYLLKDKVITFYNEDQPVCIVIKSQQYQSFEQALFETIWKYSISIKEAKVV